MMAAESAARRQQQEAEEPAPLLQTPSRFRTPDRKLAQRGRAVASEFSTHRKQTDGGYSFNLLPEESLPVTPGVPGSARKRKNTVASSNATMMAVDESPARYSPDKVKEAIMSFADFLHFLEGNQQAHQLMPVIIQRFSELGTVIESQKRHIDRWKQKELDLAICEAQQNLDLIRDLGTTIQKQELELASWQVEKQQWEEKYTLAAQANEALSSKFERAAHEHAALGDKLQRSTQEIDALKRDGTAQIQVLNAQVAQQSQRIGELEIAVRERESALETIERDSAALRAKAQQLESERSRATQDNERMGQQQGHQVAVLQTLERQVEELQRACTSEQQRAAALERDVASWQRKLQEQEQTTAELETVLENERRERGAQASSMSEVAAEARRLQTQLDAREKDHAEKLSKLQELVTTLETSRHEVMEQLTHASERYSELLRESTKQHEAESAAAMRQLEDRFLLERNRLSEQQQQQVAALQHEVAALQRELAARQQAIELHRQEPRPEDAEALRHLQEELEKATGDNDELLRELNDKEELHQDDLRTQASEFEAQYNDFVAQVEGQLSDSSQEAEQLRVELEDVTAEYKRVVHQAELLAIAKEDDAQKWRAECEQLRSRAELSERQVGALTREVEHRRQELELKESESRALREQVVSFAAPQNEAAAQQIELLQRQLTTAQQALAAKSDEANEHAVRAVEQESAHRQTVRALYAEKEALSRSLAALTADKATLERQLHTATRERDELADARVRLESDKRALDAKLQDVMTRATATLQSQQQTATLSSQDARSQLEALSAELRAREEQLGRGEQQLRDLQRSVQTLETRNRQLERELESAKSWNARLKTSVEALQSDTRSGSAEYQRALEQLTSQYERTKSELLGRIVDEEHKVSNLEAQRSADDAFHEQQLADALQQLQTAQSALEALEEQHCELEREHEALNHDAGEQRRILEQAARLEAQHGELQRIHEQLRIEFAGQSADSATTIAELEDHAAQLQTALEREQQRVQQLQSQASAGSRESELLKRARDQVRDLEAANEQLRRQLQSSDERRAVKEQGLLHESLAKERELRAAQSRCTALEHETENLRRELLAKTQQNDEWGRVLDERGSELEHARHSAEAQIADAQRAFDARRRELETQIDELEAAQDALSTEKRHLERELHNADEQLATREQELQRKDEQLDALRRESRSRDVDERLEAYARDADELIAQLAKKDEIIDGLHHVNQQQLDALDDKDSELAALSRANSDHMAQLAGKDEELDALKREARRHASELSNTRSELAALQRKFDDTVRGPEALEQRPLRRSGHLSASDANEHAESALESQVLALQRKADAAVARERTLESDVAALRTEKRELQRRLKTSNDAKARTADTDTSSSNNNNSALLQELSRVLALVKSLESQQSRQDALLRNKEAQITDLSAQVRTLKATARTRTVEAASTRQQPQRLSEEDTRELEQLSDEVTRLQLENRKLRARSGDTTSRRIADEWERQYPKLQAQVRELVAENALLRDSRVPASEMKRLETEIDALSALVQRKDSEIDALRRNDTTPRSGAGTSPRDSRRMKELIALVQKKETKILVLNDHLTELMTHSARLQLENECYATKFGALSGPMKRAATANAAQVS